MTALGRRRAGAGTAVRPHPTARAARVAGQQALLGALHRDIKTPSGLTSALEGLAQRRHTGATRITDRSLGLLAHMDTLERLEFWACAGITNARVAALARLPRLREVVLDGLPGVAAEARAGR